MKSSLLALCLVFASTAFAVTEEETLQAYSKVADSYPRLVLNLLKKNNDTVACQKVYVLNLTREGFESKELGKKLAKYNPWVYRNFTSSFKHLDVLRRFCSTRASRAAAVRAAEAMAGISLLEGVTN
jgi:hypothetical protein